MFLAPGQWKKLGSPGEAVCIPSHRLQGELRATMEIFEFFGSHLNLEDLNAGKSPSCTQICVLA